MKQDLLIGYRKEMTDLEFIMEATPELTGDTEEDLRALREHIAELQDELEYTFKRRLLNETE